MSGLNERVGLNNSQRRTSDEVADQVPSELFLDYHAARAYGDTRCANRLAGT